MKYRIKSISERKKVNWLMEGDIIELEPIDEPKETLEQKIQANSNLFAPEGMISQEAADLAQIAKEHYQENPEELAPNHEKYEDGRLE